MLAIRWFLRRSQNRYIVAAQFKRSLNGIRQAHADSVANDQPINHRLNPMPPVLVEPDRLGAIQLNKLTINPRANESFAPEFFDYIPELARLILDQRRQHNDFGAHFVRQDLINNLLRRLPAQWPPGERIVRLTHSGKENPQIIVNFSGGRDCRSWIGAGAALLDGNRRRQALDKIDIWFFHLSEELPRISRKAFDISALPFGIKSVEGQRGFPRATQSGDDDQLLPWNLDVEVLEIVLASTANLDNLRRHSDEECRTF